MAAASAAAGRWTAADDARLKKAVEAGASLESLAKGAVCFSHKFTLQELQDRWYSLLYDSETSVQASACMAKYEMELSVSNPAKALKLFNSKAKYFSLGKRKIDSVKNHYYAMRKRVCHEPCLSADFGYIIAPCSCNPIDASGCACGGHLLAQKVDSSGDDESGYGFTGGSCADREHIHSSRNGQYSFRTENANSDGSVVIDGNTNCESPNGYSCVDQLYGCDEMQKDSQTIETSIISTDNRSDLSDQFDNVTTGSKTVPGIHQGVVKHGQFSGNITGGLLQPGSFKEISEKCCSQAPSIFTWSKVHSVNSHDMHGTEPETLTLSDDKKMETNNSDALAFHANLDGVIYDSGTGSAVVSEGGFMHSHLKGFSQKELGIRRTEHFSDPTLGKNQEDLGDPHTEVFLMPPSDTTICGNHIDPVQENKNVADISEVDTICGSSEVLYPEHTVECMLNTEDSEIPFNDHLLIPGQSYLEPTSMFDQDCQHDMCLVLAKSINMENAEPSSPPPAVNVESAILEEKENMVCPNEGSIAGREPPGLRDDFGGNKANMCVLGLHAVDEGEETTCDFFQHECSDNLHNLALGKSIQVPDRMGCKFLSDKPKIGCETAIKSCGLDHALPDMEFHNPISTSGQAEESDSENSVPNYFDLEALILDQDLIPWDQESDFIQPEVSKFQYPEKGKDLIRLEKSACSYMNRSIMSKGAFAILYGQHLKYYIREPKVTLGRETGDVHVDIDLAKEGRANKISRQQAVIKMDDGGSFYIQNIGKCSIFVNSKEIPCNKRINLISDSLLEIRNMKFIFHVNHNAVKKHILRTRRGSSQGENTAFDWNQSP